MDRKIKVLMGMDVYLPDMDGVINCMDNYCMNLNSKTQLLAIAPKNKKSYKDNCSYEILRCKSVYIQPLKQYYACPKSDRKFKSALKNQEFDIIHIHSAFNMGRFALKLAKEKNIPIIATFHSNFRSIFKKIFKFNLLNEFFIKNYFGKFYNQLDEILVCSDEIASQAKSFGYKGKISFMPLGTEFEKPTNLEKLKEQSGIKLNLKQDELMFLFVGRIMELKRIDFILDSLKIVKEKGIKFKFFVCGKGVYLENLKKYSKKLGFVDEIVFTGFIGREDLKTFYSRADLFLFPSLYDNFGLVKVEAAAFSTPCLFIKNSASAIGITDNVNGFLCEDNAACFAAKIEEVVKNPTHLKQVGINAANDIYISWSECTNHLMNKYLEIISNYKNKK